MESNKPSLSDAVVTIMKHHELTEVIIGCAYEVLKELGPGFLESVYEKAMLIALSQKGLSVKVQQPIAVYFRGVNVGDFYADLVVEDKVILELKAVKSLSPQHQAQVINYLQATGYEVGLLFNFGNRTLEFKRLTRTKLTPLP